MLAKHLPFFRSLQHILFNIRGVHVLVAIGPNLSQTLDVSRWLAAALVLIYHLRINILVDPNVSPGAYSGIWGNVVLAATSCGPQAVIWFFVISGFLVGGGALADVSRGRFSVSRYAIHRISRIYIVLIPALVIGYAIDSTRISIFGIDPNAGSERISSYSEWTFLANVLSLQTIVAPHLGSNSPLWSLACEVWYYVIFAFAISIVVATKNFGSRLILIVAAAAITIFLLIANYKIIAYFPFWLLGVAVRLMPSPIMRSKSISWIIVAIFTLSHKFSLSYFPHASDIILQYTSDALLACAFANLLLASMYSQNVPNESGARINSYLAGFSFSLYVVHAPALHLVLTMIKGESNPQLDFVNCGLEAIFIGGLLFGGLCFYAWVFSRLTETNASAARRALEGIVAWMRRGQISKLRKPT
jgi:peptidoglycan/LPS O-acetylase OafA/YrhL